MFQKNVAKEKMLTYKALFLSTISIDSCMIIHYIAEIKRHIKDCFEINGKQTIKKPKKG